MDPTISHIAKKIRHKTALSKYTQFNCYVALTINYATYYEGKQ